MARPVFTPVYEEAETDIKDRMLGRIGDDWRKEKGDFMHDAIDPSPLEIKQLEANQDEILKHSFAQFAEGSYLDLRLGEVGLTRGQATANKRTLSITADAGVVIPAGHTLSTVVLDHEGNPLEFTVDAAATYEVMGSLDFAVTCKTVGEISNVPNGSEFILSPSIPGVRSITDLGTSIPGINTESDESAWQRYDFKVKNPDTGGNRNDYMRWAREIPGVEKVKVIPLWQGGGTVKVVIVDAQYQPASDILVNEVQNYLDPGITGLGDGKAPCGAFVTVIKAGSVPITVEANVTWSEGADPEAAKASFTTAVEQYRKSLAFSKTPNVAYNRIGAILSFTEGVENYSDLTLNGGTNDIIIGSEAIPTIAGINLWTI